MKHLLAILLLCAAAQARDMTPVEAAVPLSDAPSHRAFWTIENRVGFGVLGGFVVADAITTQRGLHQGLREANPLMRPFVTRGAAGETIGSTLGFGAGLGAVYLMHKTHHYRAERIAMRLMVAGEGAVVANNIVAIR